MKKWYFSIVFLFILSLCFPKPIDVHSSGFFQAIGGAAGSVQGSDTQVQFNDSGAFAGDAGFTYNKTTDIATLVGGLIIYDPSNDGNPEVRIGAVDAEEAHIQAVYDSGAQTFDYLLFQTDAASATADKGEYRFNVDGSLILTVDDGGLELNGASTISTSTGQLDIQTDAGDGNIELTANGSGTIEMNSPTNFGVDDSGVDVNMYTATSGRGAFLDESADKYIFDLATEFGDQTNKVVISNAGAITYEGTAKPTHCVYLSPETAYLPTSNPAARLVVAGASISYNVLDFDDSTDESAFWDFQAPDAYDEGDATVKVYWISNAATTGDCRFDVDHLSVGNSEAQDAAPTDTALNVQTTDSTAKDLNITTGTLTTPFDAGDIVRFGIRRDVDQGDDLVGDARVRGVQVCVSVGS